jgi:hypothetical protein
VQAQVVRAGQLVRHVHVQVARESCTQYVPLISASACAARCDAIRTSAKSAHHRH